MCMFCFVGIIYVKEALDREQYPEYSLKVEASDGVQPDSTVTVTIRLTDVNDEKPTFTQPWFSFDVLEDARTGLFHKSHLGASLLGYEPLLIGLVQGRVSEITKFFSPLPKN